MPTIHRGFRYKLAPTPDQEETFRQFAGTCRFIYNLALEQREREWMSYRDNGTPLTFARQSLEITQLRAEVDWIAAVPRACLEQVLRDLWSGLNAFFEGRSRYPTFRRKGEREAFRFQGRNCQVRRINGRWSAVRLPSIGWVKFRDTRPIRGTAKNVTVSLDALGWHVSFGCEIEHEAPVNNLPSVGIDRGVANTLALSTGELLSIPASLAKLDRKHRRAQRVVARRVKGSNRRAVAKHRAARIAAKRARIRKDWHHRISRQIADRFGTVALEDLKVVNMTASGRGKRGLNRSILNQGWTVFATILAYKLEERGGSLILVNPAYTSQTCSSCGTIDKRSRESQASFVCQHCGFEAHADRNAAINIQRGSTASVEGSHWAPDEARTVTHVAEAA